MLVRVLSEVLDLQFSRIQFTPDLMPADILGTNVVLETEKGGRVFEFQPGPIFANLILADEINRATPKTQSALLEAMQEQHVTIGRTTYQLKQPFFVMATQNPLEMEGTYPLPEAQMDRFLFKLKVTYPTADEFHTILDRTTQASHPEITKVVDAERIIEMRRIVREVPIAHHVQDFAVRLVMATHPGTPTSHPLATKYVRYGASPRGAQGLVITAKIRALLEGRFNVSRDDIREVALPALRHRLLLNFEGEAQGLDTDDIINEIVKATKETEN
jgi:MoxR-like ATPase